MCKKSKLFSSGPKSHCKYLSNKVFFTTVVILTYVFFDAAQGETTHAAQAPRTRHGGTAYVQRPRRRSRPPARRSVGVGRPGRPVVPLAPRAVEGTRGGGGTRTGDVRGPDEVDSRRVPPDRHRRRVY